MKLAELFRKPTPKPDFDRVLLIRILKQLITQGDQMSELNDAVDAVEAKLSEIDLKLDEVRSSVQAVIGFLSQPNPDVVAAIAKLTNIAGTADALKAEAQGIKDEADAAIPPSE